MAEKEQAVETVKEDVEVVEEEKLLSEEEVNRLIAQTKSKAKAEAKKDMEEELQKRLDEEKRLSALSEREQQDERLSQRERDLDEREATIIFKERLAETEEELRKRDLSVSFAKLLIGETDEQTLEQIKSFESAFHAAVEQEVKKALSGKTPTIIAGDDTVLSKSEFERLSYQERLQFKNEQPKLYEEYTKGD